MANVNVLELLRQSQWVVSGTIHKMGAATLRAVSPTDSTAVVKVDRIFYGPQPFTDHLGKLITIQLRDIQPAKKGYKAVFFTRSWLYGDSVAVVEVGRVTGADNTAMQKDIDAASQNLADQRLADRLARATLVIAGKVTQTAPAREAQRRRIETEHDPDWWTAEIAVASVEKGALTAKTVTILFPNSTDELWIDTPKCKPGQDGIWILQRDQKEKGWPVLRAPGLTALDPLDYQTRDQLDRVRRLVKR
jgi:hypothetical protein